MTRVQVSVRALDAGGNDEFAMTTLDVEATDLKVACVQGLLRSHGPITDELGVDPAETLKAMGGRLEEITTQLEERGLIGRGMAAATRRLAKAATPREDPRSEDFHDGAG